MISQELAEYASTHAGGSHNLQQQLKQGLFTRNPRLFETAAYAFFVAIFLWLCLSTQGGEPAFAVSLHTNDLQSHSTFDALIYVTCLFRVSDIDHVDTCDTICS